MLVDSCLDALNKALFLVYSIVTLILSNLQEELGCHLAQYDTNLKLQRTLSSPPYAIINCVHGDRNKAVTCTLSTRKKVHVPGAGILQTKDC